MLPTQNKIVLQNNPSPSNNLISPLSQFNIQAQKLQLQIRKSKKATSSLWDIKQAQMISLFQLYPSLPMSKIKPTEISEIATCRLVKGNDKVYLGEVFAKQKHGKGISIHKDGRIYEGQFVKNEKSGFGCDLYANGNFYIGEFSQNKKHGKGSFYWFSLCQKSKKEDLKQFQQYHGQWWGGLPDGKGQHLKANGDHYIGNFKSGLKHGNGVQYYANGDKYQGEFVNGLAEGHGEYFWLDGSTYKGDFKQGCRNGYGFWKTKNGAEKYQGHYLIDKKHGYGVYEWPTGETYKGTYVEDKRQGQGELYINGELSFKGIWENGQEKPSKNINEFGEDFAVSSGVKYKSERLKNIKEKSQDKQQLKKSSINFRVKTKGRLKINREQSATSSKTVIRKKLTQYSPTTASNLSSHRGCLACRTRSIKGDRFKKNDKSIDNPDFK